MALLRKKHSEWYPSENNGLQIGETVEITDYRRLVESGMADLVDEFGNVMPLPDTIFVCGICFVKCVSHSDYMDHALTAHKDMIKKEHSILEKKPEIPAKEEKSKEFNITKEIKRTAEERKAYGEKMRLAREAAKARRENAKKERTDFLEGSRNIIE